VRAVPGPAATRGRCGSGRGRDVVARGRGALVRRLVETHQGVAVAAVGGIRAPHAAAAAGRHQVDVVAGDQVASLEHHDPLRAAVRPVHFEAAHDVAAHHVAAAEHAHAARIGVVTDGVQAGHHVVDHVAVAGDAG